LLPITERGLRKGTGSPSTRDTRRKKEQIRGRDARANWVKMNRPAKDCRRGKGHRGEEEERENLGRFNKVTKTRAY